MSNLPILLPTGLMGAAVLALLAGLWRSSAARAVAMLATAGATVAAVVGLVHTIDDRALRHDVGGWAPPIGIEYVLDPLSGFMAALIAFIGFLVVAFPPTAGFGQTPRRGVPIHSLTLLLLTGLMGVVMSGDLFNLFVFLEIYSVASFALIALGGDRAVIASFRYLVLSTIGSGFYLLGVGFVYFSTGTLNMADAASQLTPLTGSSTIAAAAVLIAVGLGIKMALFPLHTWLPDAHSFAPPAVAALLAGIQVKAAVYAIIRVLLDVFPHGYVIDELPIMTFLAWFGAAGIVVGSVLAIRQRDFKRMLAWSTVAQLGFIGLGIGLANPLALTGALLHVLNHAFMKCCLFFVAGSVIARTGIKEIPRFAGLAKTMPATMVGFGLAAAAMVGIPPTAGFFSKWYLVLGSVDAGAWFFAVLIVASSLLTLAYFLRVFERVFMVPPEEPAVADAQEASAGMLLPIGVLAIGVVALGLVNLVIVSELLEPIAEGLVGSR